MLHHWPIPGDQMSPPPATLLHAKDSINGSWIPSSTEQSLCKPLLFSRSARIGYLPLWMHQGLSPPWLITSRGFIATLNMKSRLAIKFPPPLMSGDQMPGVCRGGMFKLRFDWYITSAIGKGLHTSRVKILCRPTKTRLSAVATTFL